LLGEEENSIGIYGKNEIMIDASSYIDGNEDESFVKGNVVGIGIIYSATENSSMQYFVTCNGQLLGKRELKNIL